MKRYTVPSIVIALSLIAGCADEDPASLAVRGEIQVEVTPLTLALRVAESGRLEGEEKLVLDGKVTSRSPCVKCEWAVADGTIARIEGNPNGVGVTMVGVSEGQTIVYARWFDHTVIPSVTKEAKATVTVTRVGAPAPSRVTISPSSGQIDPGQTTNFVCTAFDGGNAVMANPLLDWTSSAPGVATVDAAGRVLGVADGTATITCTGRGSTVAASAIVTVRTTPRQLILDPADATVLVGNSYKLQLTVRNPVTGLSLTTGDVTITVAPAAARVDRNATNPIRDFDVVGLTAGVATITMTYQGPGGGTGTATVRVVAANSNAVLSTPQGRALVKGQTLTVGGGVNTLTDQPVPGLVTWRSENADIATVAGNVVTGVKAGVTKIIGESPNAIPGANLIQVIDQAPTCSASDANLTFRTSVLYDPAAKAAQYNVPATLNFSVQVSGTNITITGPMGTGTTSFSAGTCNFFTNQATGPIGSLPSTRYRIQGYYGSPGQIIWVLMVEPTGSIMTQYRLDRQ